MNAIVCVDENWGIGKDGSLLFSIPDDMKHFVEMTKNNIIVIGRKTLESFKNKKPLKNRLNIVLTKDKNLYKNYTKFDDIVFAFDKSEVYSILSDLTHKFPKYANAMSIVCGGDSIYKLFLDDCDEIYVTKMFKSFEADTYFPNLDDNSNYKIINESKILEYEGIKYQFLTYKNEKKRN